MKLLLSLQLSVSMIQLVFGDVIPDSSCSFAPGDTSCDAFMGSDCNGRKCECKNGDKWVDNICKPLMACSQNNDCNQHEKQEECLCGFCRPPIIVDGARAEPCDVIFATNDDGDDCLDGWSKVTGQTQCNPPTELTDTISCTSSQLSITIKPSHVFDDYSAIPDTVLSTLKVQIQGSSGSYQDFITFGSDNTGLEGAAVWSTISPKLHSTNDKIFMTYKLKVDDPSISFGSTTIYTTKNVNEFYIQCSMNKAVTVTSSAVTMETIELGAATNGTAASEIDTSSIFSLATYSDNTYATTLDTFEIGSSVYAKVDATNMANMPDGINWEVNECKAVGDANTHKMPIFEAAGTCINPYLDVASQATTDTGKQFRFKAFSFDTANVDDSIEITCSIKLGKTGDNYSDRGDTCDALLETAS